MLPFQPISGFESIQWPAIPTGSAAPLWALLQQLEQMQWQDGHTIASQQWQQLSRLVAHARRTVPYYAQRLSEEVVLASAADAPRIWSAVPLLTRRDIQEAGPALQSTALPKSHGSVSRITTSGSTGMPVSVLSTDVTRLFWNAITIRDHLWHGRDFGATLGAIRFAPHDRALPPHGIVGENWGSATRGLMATGPAVLLNIRSSTEEQFDWLQRLTPAYLLTYPSVFRALAHFAIEKGARLPGLLQMRTFGELVTEADRALCDKAFGVPLIDTYSTQEVGYIALQCPLASHYHVQSESLLVEVLRDDGTPCGPLEVGRVVLTSLHNFASPIIRYDLGDFAEVGEPCRCGRGLPVLKRIVGRERNLLVLPDGRRRWPAFGQAAGVDALPRIRQFQAIQRSLDTIVVKVVRDAPFTTAESEQVCRYLAETLGHPFRFVFEFVDDIPRGPGGKFEDFKCEVSAHNL